MTFSQCYNAAIILKQLSLGNATTIFISVVYHIVNTCNSLRSVNSLTAGHFSINILSIYLLDNLWLLKSPHGFFGVVKMYTPDSMHASVTHFQQSRVQYMQHPPHSEKKPKQSRKYIIQLIYLIGRSQNPRYLPWSFSNVSLAKW